MQPYIYIYIHVPCRDSAEYLLVTIITINSRKMQPMVLFLQCYSAMSSQTTRAYKRLSLGLNVLISSSLRCSLMHGLRYKTFYVETISLGKVKKSTLNNVKKANY